MHLKFRPIVAEMLAKYLKDPTPENLSALDLDRWVWGIGEGLGGSICNWVFANSQIYSRFLNPCPTCRFDAPGGCRVCLSFFWDFKRDTENCRKLSDAERYLEFVEIAAIVESGSEK